MKRTALVLTIALTIGITAVVQGNDMKKSMDMSGHDMTGTAKSHDAMTMDNIKSMAGGKEIHSSMVNGHHLTYKLIDMSEKISAMKPSKHSKKMPDMKHTYHLMVFVKSPTGKLIDDAKVGYLIKGPNGESQKIMTMGMHSGFGADVILKEKGSYTITSKIKAGSETLKDTFKYRLR